MDDGREVAVLVRGRVRVRERAEELRGDEPDRVVAELLLAALEVLHEPLEVRAVDVLQHEHEPPVELEEVENAQDRGVIQPRADGGLARELLAEIRVALERVLDELQLADATEAHRTFHQPEVHVGGPRARKAPDDLVRPDAVGDGLRRKHCWDHRRKRASPRNA